MCEKGIFSTFLINKRKKIGKNSVSLPGKNRTIILDIPLFCAFVSVIHLQLVSNCYVVVAYILKVCFDRWNPQTPVLRKVGNRGANCLKI